MHHNEPFQSIRSVLSHLSCRSKVKHCLDAFTSGVANDDEVAALLNLEDALASHDDVAVDELLEAIDSL